MPHTSKVAILIMALILLLNINTHAQLPLLGNSTNNVEIWPHYLNAGTYTNLTISVDGKPPANVTAINATVDFVAQTPNATIMGIWPLSNPVKLIIKTITNTTIIKYLSVENICNISYSANNFTNIVNITVSSNCENISIYLNGTRIGGASAFLAPNYSGVYQGIVTNQTYYLRFTYVVSPKILVGNITYGQSLNVTLTPPLVSPGYLVISSPTYSAQYPISNSLELQRFQLPAGNYTASVVYGQLALAEANFTIYRATPSISISFPQSYVYGQEPALTVNSSVAGVVYPTQAQILINNTPISTAPITLPYRANAPLLNAGTYVITVSTLPNQNLTSATASFVFNVLPAPVSIAIYGNGTPLGPLKVLSYGNVLSLSYVLSSPTLRPQGTVMFYVNGTPIGPTLDTMSLGAGVYVLTAFFTPSNKNFERAAANATIIVTRSVPTIAAPSSVYAVYGERPNFTIGLLVNGRPASGTVIVSVAGQMLTYYVKGFTTIYLPPLPAGIYPVLISFSGTRDLYPVNSSLILYIVSASTKLVLKAPSRSIYGVPIHISISITPAIPGVLSLYVNGTQIWSGGANSTTIVWSPPRSGHFNITALFQSASRNYSNAFSSILVYVERAPCSIDLYINSSNIYVLRKYRISINSSVNPYIYIDRELIGIGSVVFSLNSTGPHTISAVFPGDDKYLPCNADLVVDAVKNPVAVKLYAGNALALPNEPIRLALELETPAGVYSGEVILIIHNLENNKNYTIIKYVSSRLNILNISIEGPGPYEVQAYYMGNSYVSANYSNPVALTVVQSFLGIPNIILAGYLLPIAAAYAVVIAVKLKNRAKAVT
ncbi:MAG: Ig-like domain repeat protein [Thermoproteus sp. AZ2]|uniref:Ig-like domain repeat protein n=1 Tax=Thermoproteus sp. AZ2 TaxID=1609232 RepID=A0ACC6UZG4_9CREN